MFHRRKRAFGNPKLPCEPRTFVPLLHPTRTQLIIEVHISDVHFSQVDVYNRAKAVENVPDLKSVLARAGV
jgi:hypothetical protein